MAVETIDYNGYRLEVVPVGKGWRVSIYPPDSTSALRESPSILEKERWSRLSEQIFRVDKWSVCRG